MNHHRFLPLGVIAPIIAAIAAWSLIVSPARAQQLANVTGEPIRYVVTVDPHDFAGDPHPGFDPCACGRHGASLFLTQPEIDALTIPHKVVSRLDDYMRRFRPSKTMEAVGVPSISKLLGEPVPSVWPMPNGATAGTLSLTYERYHTPQEGIEFYHALANAYPDIVRISSIGTSVEGRELWALKISDNPNDTEAGEAKAMYCGLHHAREWVTHEMMLYLAQQLVTGYDTNPRIKHIVDNSEIWLVLAANPDGFMYTWTDERFWRKNRRYNGVVFGIQSYGVDINRNYDYNWGPGFGGSSGNFLSETYRGMSAASEPETQALQSFLTQLKPTLAISYHTYSQLVLYPWGYTGASVAQGYTSHRAIADKYAALVEQTHGAEYLAGPVNYTLYTTNGDFTDYAYGVHGTIAFTPEMRPNTEEMGGFALPEDQIQKNCEENYAAALWMLDNVANVKHVEIPETELLAPGENLFSFPSTPLNQKPELAFSMDSTTAMHWSGWLNDVAHVTPGFFEYPQSGVEGLSSGFGYRFEHTLESAAWADSFTGYDALPYVFDGGAVVPIRNFVIPGTNYVGVPFEKPVRLSDVSIVRRRMQITELTFGYYELVLERRTALEDLASPSPWINWRWKHETADGQFNVSHPTGMDGADEYVHPFRSYGFTGYVSSWQFPSETNAVFLLIFPEPVRADSHADGVVDLADYTALHTCSGGPVPIVLDAGCALNDFDHDFDVDLADFGFLQRQFGLTAP